MTPKKSASKTASPRASTPRKKDVEKDQQPTPIRILKRTTPLPNHLERDDMKPAPNVHILPIRLDSPNKREASSTFAPGSPPKKSQSSRDTSIPSGSDELNLDSEKLFSKYSGWKSLVSLVSSPHSSELNSDSMATELRHALRTHMYHEDSILALDTDIRLWEWSMLDVKSGRSRMVVKVGEDGQDTFVQEPVSNLRFVTLAQGIIGATQENKHLADAREKEMDWKGRQFSSLYLLAQDCGICQPRDIYPAVYWFLKQKFHKDRQETYRCMATHPHYSLATPKDRIAMKQELIRFFDRRFTAQIFCLTGNHFEIGTDLFRLGGDETFPEDLGLDTGGNDPVVIFNNNEALWGKYHREHKNRPVRMTQSLSPRRPFTPESE
ncbi:hypothetical protein G7Y89_g742 [Cudoniella acicularis]|uniref:Uncharacterized protein n=1 Tax=Cudoniella acicularis TaxID=354080 RepID=A0A8H4RZE5_9HELO|nr:hypothetical protein G7Y89_g742 [Cudoniella acicularis]